MPVDQFSARWTGVYKADKDGTVKFQLAGDDGYRLFVNDKLITGDWGEPFIQYPQCIYAGQYRGDIPAAY